MLVSIIVNNFNYGRFLRSAIDSALNQTYPHVETIVVDDGSTDDSRDIIQSYGTRIKPVLKKNGGQGSAFNAGFNASHGELILFLDSDDTLCSHAIDSVVKCWSADMAKLHFPLHTIDENGARLGKTFPKPILAVGNALPTLLREGDYCSPPTSGNAFSRKFLESVMPVPEHEWRDFADCYIVQTAPFYGQIGRISENLGEYRIHGTNLTAGADEGRIRLHALHKRLRSGERKQRLLEQFSAIHGLKTAPNVVTDTQDYFKVRLVSLKISPSTHPIKGDRLLPTLGRLLVLTINNQKSRLITRFAYLLWAPLVAVLPAKFSEWLAVPAVSPHSRSRFREAIVGQ